MGTREWETENGNQGMRIREWESENGNQRMGVREWETENGNTKHETHCTLGDVNFPSVSG